MKFNVSTAILVVLVLGAVLGAIAMAIQAIDPKTIPSELQPVWTVIVFVFTTSAATPLFTGLRNIYGYWNNKYGVPSNVRDSVQYEANQFVATYVRLEGYIKGINLFLVSLTQNTPLAIYTAYISGSAAFILDVIIRTAQGLAKPSNGTAAQTVPVNPPA